MDATVWDALWAITCPILIPGGYGLKSCFSYVHPMHMQGLADQRPVPDPCLRIEWWAPPETLLESDQRGVNQLAQHI